MSTSLTSLPWRNIAFRVQLSGASPLLRQYLPKNADLRRYDQDALDAIAELLNGRPRQTLGWKTPSEALDEVLR